MMVFVIPLRSKESSHDWHLVEKHIERTLKSVCNQTSPYFKVLVVCSEIPKINYNNSNVIFIRVNFKPTSDASYEEKIIDKFRRKWVGFSYALKFAPCHIMSVDDDDCVNKNLSEFADNNPHAPGWYMDRGYVLKEDSKLIYVRKKCFFSLCDSSLIRRHDLIVFPHKIKNAWFDRKILETYFSEKYFMNLLKERGIFFEPLPFIGTVYIIGNKENLLMRNWRTLHKGNLGKGIASDILLFVKEIRYFRILSKSIRNEFGLYDINMTEIR